MHRRPTVAAALALLLSACGAEESYAIPAAEATTMLAGLGTSPAISPMPAPLNQVTTRFEALPDGQSVQWAFIGNEGQDLGRILATVKPSGEQASKVSVHYVKGSAPGGRWMTDQVRAEIEKHMPRLLTEAVDSTLEGRAFDMALRGEVEEAIKAGLTATMFQGIHSEMKKSIEESDAKSRVWDAERKARASRPVPVRELPPPSRASQPTTDLSKFR